MRAVAGHQVEPRNLWVKQVLARRLLGAVQQLVAVDDLQHAVFVGAVAEIHAVAFRAGGDRAVQRDRDRARCAGLLPGQAERADKHRLRRVREIVNKRHAVASPLRLARNQIRNTGIAFPPVLVRAFESPHNNREQLRMRRVGGIPDFVCQAAEHAQHVKLAFDALRQFISATDSHHLRAALLGFAGFARYVGEILRMLWIGHVEERGAVVLHFAVKGVELIVAVMANVCDPAIALLLDNGLIGGARLQVVVADERHVAALRACLRERRDRGYASH